VLDHIEDDCIYQSILYKKNNFFSKSTFNVFLYPNALILTEQGKVSKVFKIGNFDSKCCTKLVDPNGNAYQSIIQKCKPKKNSSEFDFVVLPYTVEKFATKSLEETDMWLNAFEKIKGSTVFTDPEEEERTSIKSIFSKGSCSFHKIKNLEKRVSSMYLTKK
jgi:hypothetical protein